MVDAENFEICNYMYLESLAVIPDQVFTSSSVHEFVFDNGCMLGPCNN